MFRICLLVAALVTCGCSLFNGASRAKPAFVEASELSSRGSYGESLKTYELILAKYPTAGDRALFEMGIVYAHPANKEKDYRKALESFQRLVRSYPESGYRQDSEMMIFYIDNVTVRDGTIAAQQATINRQQADMEVLRQEVRDREEEIAALQRNVAELTQKHLDYVLQNGAADRIVVEKKKRRLTLMSKGEVLKSYRVALGGDPDGPKERQGDNKTPEGTYIIDSRNSDSRYHLSLHISYPNEKDRKRARELGVAPGGDIMIHGIKNGFSSLGYRHAEIDWTKGCIAVTDEEIEEIARLAPNGTVVEIRP